MGNKEKIINYLTTHTSGAKAWQIAAAISIAKSEVNSILYSNKNIFTVDSSFVWRLKVVPVTSAEARPAVTTASATMPPAAAQATPVVSKTVEATDATYRIHGDNIVECERIASIIIDTLQPDKINYRLVSPSTISLQLTATFNGRSIKWQIELLPGFNKNTKRRWSGNIFDPLKEAGSFFDETPDAIISQITEKGTEKILLAIEFCSALQAGNQAWQRSARAFSTGRTGCPYIYIVDFVKYELDNETRERKNLRFPNAAVPYSYINYAKTTHHFVAQLYTKAEEFDKTRDRALSGFDENDFGTVELGAYIVKAMLGLDTSDEEQRILQKNMNVVRFLANHSDEATNFTAAEWKQIYEQTSGDIVDFAVKKRRFGFHKTIAEKSHHGKSPEVITLVDSLSVGLASRDLPFGIIPAASRATFAKKYAALYPEADPSIIKSIGDSSRHLIIAIFKGFKPRGDDNRPDRGLLPLAAMLSAADIDVMSYIYGPMIDANLKLLESNPLQLADKNGLWRSILSLSDFVALDVPVIGRKKSDAARLLDTRKIKTYYKNLGIGKSISDSAAFSSVSVNLGEDDVDTAIHYLFTHLLGDVCFEGMCNPPGGDWSGFSVIAQNKEHRWLSLPRVSDVVNGKRPDHIIEMFGVFDKPLLISVESKEKSADLEEDVGNRLIAYIESIMGYVPSAVKNVSGSDTSWHWGSSKVDFSGFETISAAAYLKEKAEPASIVFEKNCEILFVMDPIMGKKTGWEIEIIPSSNKGRKLKQYIIDRHAQSGDEQFTIK